jgi:Asp-tRNA(Asn)/Glu-tRNA(Gln) amidotransferase A subunit family amidase
MGLTSRGGVFPLNSLADIAGPMTRTMEDAVRVFQVIVGHDPDDPASIERPKRNYMQALLREGLNGARIGVLRQAYERESADPEVLKVFRSALSDLERAGATIVDTVQVELPERPRQASACMGFAYDLHLFLAPRLPDMTLAQVLKSGEFHPNNRQRIENALKDPGKGPDSPECQARGAYVASFREAVSSTMRRLRLDAFVYPTWSNPPRLIGDLNTPHGDNSQLFSPGTGFPAINVPMGYTRGGTLPAGITFFGGEWSEETLIRFAFAYEQQTRHRRPPPSTPPLR